jgi:hypothetical protein
LTESDNLNPRNSSIMTLANIVSRELRQVIKLRGNIVLHGMWISMQRSLTHASWNERLQYSISMTEAWEELLAVHGRKWKHEEYLYCCTICCNKQSVIYFITITSIKTHHAMLKDNCTTISWWANTRMHAKVSGLAAWSENCNWYSSLPLDAVVSLFCESL